MKVKVWGARGSVPAPGPKMNRYGGNTSCVQLDARQRRGPDPRRRHRDPHPRPRPGHGAEGQHPAHPPAPRPHPGPDVLPALLPLRRGDHDLGAGLAGGLARGPGRPLHLRSAVAGRGARAALLGLLSRHAAERVADRLGDDPHRGGEPPRARPSASGSPRATRRSATSPTTSPALGASLADLEPEWISGYDLARDADLLIHDCQYTDEEYPEHIGWGHSRIDDTLTFANRVGAKRLLLFHHDPLHSDDFLDDFHVTARRRWEELGGDPTLVEMGMEGGELEVAPAAATAAVGAPPRSSGDPSRNRFAEEFSPDGGRNPSARAPLAIRSTRGCRGIRPSVQSARQKSRHRAKDFAAARAYLPIRSRNRDRRAMVPGGPRRKHG